MTDLNDYLRNAVAVDHFVHVTHITDKTVTFTISPSGIPGDPVEIKLGHAAPENHRVEKTEAPAGEDKK